MNMVVAVFKYSFQRSTLHLGTCENTRNASRQGYLLGTPPIHQLSDFHTKYWETLSLSSHTYVLTIKTCKIPFRILIGVFVVKSRSLKFSIIIIIHTYIYINSCLFPMQVGRNYRTPRPAMIHTYSSRLDHIHLFILF